MEVTSRRQSIRISPRKMRLVAPLIKNMPVDQALIRLQFAGKSAARPIMDVLKTARADAVHNYKLNESNLRIKEVEISEGPSYKRIRAASKGRAHGLTKRTSHLKVVLEG
jgi:large subunit ribosomal protein L22